MPEQKQNKSRRISAPPVKLDGEEYMDAMVQTIMQAHTLVLNMTGGFRADRPDEFGVVESVAYSTFAVVYGSGPEDRFSDIFDQVGHLAYHLAKRHAFSDGNKRMSVLMSLALLKWAGIGLDIADSPIPADNSLYQWIAALVTDEMREEEFAAKLRVSAFPDRETD